jgi:hypothetical protein
MRLAMLEGFLRKRHRVRHVHVVELHEGRLLFVVRSWEVTFLFNVVVVSVELNMEPKWVSDKRDFSFLQFSFT